MGKSGNKRVGFLGGTFDPIHNGHLKLGLAALKQYKLDAVYFVLSPRSPFKQKKRITSVGHRKVMLDRAVQKHKCFKMGLWETKRRGPSYSYLTLQAYRKKHKTHKLFFIMGSDTYRGINRWKEWRKIFDLSHILVGRRPGTSKININPNRKKYVSVLKGRFPNISSTIIRSRKFKLIPARVRTYIRDQHLYEEI